jgi:hypothetical protein
MIALISGIFGLLSSGLPNLLEYFKSAQDNKHELELLRLQSELAKIEAQGKLEAVGLETDAQMYHDQIQLALEAMKPTGIPFWDGVNASVRPVLAYAFFGLYATVKIMQWRAGLPWTLWSEEDQALFAGIVSFYFGQRAFRKAGRE